MSNSISASTPIRSAFLAMFSVQSFRSPSWAKQLGEPKNVFLGCIAFIVGVSIYDSYLVALFPKTILLDERNPICKMLIQQDPDGLSFFLAGKFTGNLCVVGTLTILNWIGYRRAMSVTIAVALFQLGLLAYLTFSDPLTGVLHFDDLFSHNPILAERALYSSLIHLSILTGTIIIGGMAMVSWKNKRRCLSEKLCT